MLLSYFVLMDISKRYHTFDIFRFFGCLFLMFNHYSMEFEYLNTLHHFLGFSLACFFVLSGYLIHYQLVELYVEKKSISTFYVRRMLRIFPAYYFCIFFFSLFIKLPNLPYLLTYTLNIKLFFNSLTPMGLKHFYNTWSTGGAHLWSMGIEEQFYILFPIFIIYLKQVNRNIVIWISSLGVLFIFFFLVLKMNLPNSFYGALPPVSSIYLLAGALVAELRRRGSLNKLKNHTLPTVVLTLILIYFEKRGAALFQPGYVMPAIAISMAFFIDSLVDFEQYLRYLPKTLINLIAKQGRLTYSVYCVHLFIMNPIKNKLAFFSLGLFSSYLCFFAISCIFGNLIWLFIENPIQKTGNTLFNTARLNC